MVNGLILNCELTRVKHGCLLSLLPAYATYSVKSTIRLELYAQLQLFSYSSNQPLHRLQREHFVQPLIQSGTLLVFTPVQLRSF